MSEENLKESLDSKPSTGRNGITLIDESEEAGKVVIWMPNYD